MYTNEEYQYLNNYVRYLIKREGFSSECEVSVEPGTKKGEGFLGQIFFVSLKEKDKCLNVVVKAALQNEKVRDELKIKDIYCNETYFYNKVYPALQDFEKRNNAANPLTCVPKYYGCSMEDGAETLGLENLKLQDYEIFSKKLTFDDDHVKLVFYNYGQFHGTSFVYFEKHPEEFEKVNTEICYINDVFAANEGFNQTTNTLIDDLHKDIEELNNPELLKKFDAYYDAYRTVLIQAHKVNKKHKPLLHGDCWSNNMMFKYEIKNNKKIPVKVKLLDFQMIQCSVPVYDLSYSLYSSGSKEQFDKLDDFLKIYHDSLSSKIRELGSDPEKIYPLSELKEDWKNCAKFGYIMGLLLQRLKLTDNDAVQDLNDYVNNKNGNDSFFIDNYDREEYVKRVKELTLHCYEYGVL